MKKIVALLVGLVAVSAFGQLTVTPPKKYVTAAAITGIADTNLVTTNVWWTTNVGANTLTNTAQSYQFSGISISGATNVMLYWNFTTHFAEFGTPAYLMVQWSTNGYNLPPASTGAYSSQYYSQYFYNRTEHTTNLTAIGGNGADNFNSMSPYTDASNTVWITMTNFGFALGGYYTNWPVFYFATNSTAASNIICWRLFSLWNDPYTNTCMQLAWAPLLEVPSFTLSATAVYGTGNVLTWDAQQNTNFFAISRFILERTYDSPALTNSFWTTISTNLAANLRTYTDGSNPATASYRLTQVTTNGIYVQYNIASISYGPAAQPLFGVQQTAFNTLNATAGSFESGGSFVVVGGMNSTNYLANFGFGLEDTVSVPGGPAAYMARYDWLGNLYFGNVYPGSGGFTCLANNNTNYVVGANFTGNANFGNFSTNSHGTQDAMVIQYNAVSPNWNWQRQFFANPPLQVFSKGVTLDNSGNVYAALSFSDGTFVDCGNGQILNLDAGVVKLDHSGNTLYAVPIGWPTYYNMNIVGIGHDPVGDTVDICGRQTVSGVYVSLLQQLDPTVGIPTLQSKSLTNCQVTCLAVATNGNVAIGGAAFGPINFGGGTITTPGTNGGGAFVAVYDRNFSWLTNWMFGSSGDSVYSIAVDNYSNVIWNTSIQGLADPTGGTNYVYYRSQVLYTLVYSIGSGYQWLLPVGGYPTFVSSYQDKALLGSTFSTGVIVDGITFKPAGKTDSAIVGVRVK